MVRYQHTPKVRQYAEITMIDGVILSGYVFVEATSRISDLLDNGMPFMPFVDSQEQIQLIQKSAIIRIKPYD